MAPSCTFYSTLPDWSGNESILLSGVCLIQPKEKLKCSSLGQMTPKCFQKCIHTGGVSASFYALCSASIFLHTASKEWHSVAHEIQSRNVVCRWSEDTRFAKNGTCNRLNLRIPFFQKCICLFVVLFLFVHLLLLRQGICVVFLAVLEDQSRLELIEIHLLLPPECLD